MLVRQLEEELRMRMRGPNMELQQQVELLLNENDHLTREVAILRETIKVKKKKKMPKDSLYIYVCTSISVRRN